MQRERRRKADCTENQALQPVERSCIVLQGESNLPVDVGLGANGHPQQLEALGLGEDGKA